MINVKFKKKKRVLKPGYSLDPVKLKFIGGSHKHPVLKPRPIVPRSTSLFAPVKYNKPVKRYWGDYDKDGVINGLDCEPRNKFKQGPQHKRRKTLTKEQADSLFKSGGTPLIKSRKEEHDEIEERARKRMTAKQRKAYFADDNDDNNTEPTNKQISEAMEAEDRFGELYREEERKEIDRVYKKEQKWLDSTIEGDKD